ncbi:amidase signature domain-containing protein, partial [Phakopsora pachyrhizi]
LDGLSFGVKDIFCMRGVLTTCGSKILSNFIPNYDSAVVSNLRLNGARIIGKTNLDEFSMGSDSLFSHYGPVINPIGFCHKRQSMIHHHSAGGSSGGSAAAVAAKLCDVAIGSDTGGSTRLPATYCGVIGFKPSYGLISRYGMVQYSNSLDTVGIMARSMKFVQKTFDSLNCFDERDPTSVPDALRSKSQDIISAHQKWTDLNSLDLSRLRVGVPIEYLSSDLSGPVSKAFTIVLDFLRRRGSTIVDVSIPMAMKCLGAYYVIASAEASSNLARYSGVHYGFRSELDYPGKTITSSTPNSSSSLYLATRTEGFGKEVKRRLLLGNHVLSSSGFYSYFLKAQSVRLRLKREFDSLFKVPNSMMIEDSQRQNIGVSSNLRSSTGGGVDVLLTPPSSSPAPTDAIDETREILESWNRDRFLIPSSLAGLPSLAVPINVSDQRSVDDELPVGVQLIGQWGNDRFLIELGKLIEK